MSDAPSAERAAAAQRLRRRRTRRRAVSTLDGLAAALGIAWLLLVASGWPTASRDRPSAISPALVAVGAAIVATLGARRLLDPVTPLREVPAVTWLGERMAGGWATHPAFVPIVVALAGVAMATSALTCLWAGDDHSFGSVATIVLQAAALAAGALPLARLARRELSDPSLVAALVIAYLAFTPIRSVMNLGIDPAAFAGPALLSALVAFREGRFRLGAVLGCAALAIDPRAAVLGLMLGGYLLVVLRQVRLGAVACVVALAVLAIAWRAPVSVLGGPIAPLGAVASVAGFGLHAFTAWLVVLAPLAFLPLLAPLHLVIVLPALILGGALVAPGRGALEASWVALASPLLFAAAVFGIRKLLDREDLRVLVAFYPSVAELRRYVAALLVLGAMVFVSWSPIAVIRACGPGP